MVDAVARDHLRPDSGLNLIVGRQRRGDLLQDDAVIGAKRPGLEQPFVDLDVELVVVAKRDLDLTRELPRELLQRLIAIVLEASRKRAWMRRDFQPSSGW